MRVAVIGCGSIGTRHARNLVVLGHLPVLFDQDSTAINRLEAALAGAYGEIADSEDEACLHADAVIVATPAASHLGVVQRQLSHARDFLIEKPLGTLDQLDDWRRLAALTRPRIAVGYNWRWNPQINELLARVGARRVSYMRFICATKMATWPGRDYAEPLLECSHEIDLARMFDSQLRVRFAATRGTTSFVVQLESADTEVLIDLWWDVEPARRSFSVKFADGELETVEPSQASVDRSYLDELQDFLFRVKHQVPMACTVDDGIAVLELVAEAKRMAA